MSKATLAIVATAGAAAGFLTSATWFSSRRKDESTTLNTSTNPTPTVDIANPSYSAIPPLPPSPLHPSKGLIAPIDPAGLFKYGFPGPVNDLRVAPALISSFDRRTRNPSWVAEHITPASLSCRNGDRKHSTFAEDESIPEKFRAKLKDYFRSGYDRGHQVPAADAKWSQEATDATFALSNMCPQVGDGFNRDYWAHTEDFCRRLTLLYPSVRIVTGPLYLPRKGADGVWRVTYEVIGSPPNVAVPTHFYKVIFAEDGRVGGDVAIGAFVLPNARIANDKPLKDFEVPISAVERASGLEFAEKLPVQRKKRLCDQVDCSVIVKEYQDRQKKLTGPPAPAPAPAPVPVPVPIPIR